MAFFAPSRLRDFFSTTCAWLVAPRASIVAINVPVWIFIKVLELLPAGRPLIRRGQPVLDIHLTGCSKAASPRFVSAKAHHICTLAMSGTYSGTTIDFLTF